jgi:hypothetical protein
MATQEDIHWKLSELKKAINNSSNITSEIKDLLENVTINDIGAEVIRPSRDEIYKIYKARYHYLESIGKTNESFANLLKRLEEISNDVHLIITALRTEDRVHLVFTDKDYYECFGAIS